VIYRGTFDFAIRSIEQDLQIFGTASNRLLFRKIYDHREWFFSGMRDNNS
jgi:hypothetical protein